MKDEVYKFDEGPIELFKTIMEGLGYKLGDVNNDTIKTVFEHDNIYKKIISSLEIKKQIIDNNLSAIKDMFIYYYFGGDMFIVNHPFVGNEKAVKILGYDSNKDEVTFTLINNKGKSFCCDRKTFLEHCVSRAKFYKDGK